MRKSLCRTSTRFNGAINFYFICTIILRRWFSRLRWRQFCEQHRYAFNATINLTMALEMTQRPLSISFDIGIICHWYHVALISFVRNSEHALYPHQNQNTHRNFCPQSTSSKIQPLPKKYFGTSRMHCLLNNQHTHRIFLFPNNVRHDTNTIYWPYWNIQNDL